jgi:hypothetical protein
VSGDFIFELLLPFGLKFGHSPLQVFVCRFLGHTGFLLLFKGGYTQMSISEKKQTVVIWIGPLSCNRLGMQGNYQSLRIPGKEFWNNRLMLVAGRGRSALRSSP